MPPDSIAEPAVGDACEYPSEAQLVSEACEGDPEALTRLLELHGPAVRRQVTRRIPSRWQALLSTDDVMQQTYADSFRGIGRFISQGEGSFQKWLATLARCNLRDALKMLEADKRGGNRRRLDPEHGDSSFAYLIDQLATVSGTPSRCAAGKEARSALSEAINALPEAYRQVVRLYDLEGRSVEEVALSLDRSPGAIYMLRSRSHDRLRELMGSTSMFFSRN